MWMERTCGDLESVIDLLFERVPMSVANSLTQRIKSLTVFVEH